MVEEEVFHSFFYILLPEKHMGQNEEGQETTFFDAQKNIVVAPQLQLQLLQKEKNLEPNTRAQEADEDGRRQSSIFFYVLFLTERPSFLLFFFRKDNCRKKVSFKAKVENCFFCAKKAFASKFFFFLVGQLVEVFKKKERILLWPFLKLHN